MKIKHWILLIIGGVLGYIVYDSSSQPTTNSLKGSFKEETMYRNENNTGPIQRIYIVSVGVKEGAEMEQYGKLMPYTKYGTTDVYFFEKGKPVPTEVHPGDVPFDEQYKQYCIGTYKKGAMAEESFSTTPF